MPNLFSLLESENCQIQTQLSSAMPDLIPTATYISPDLKKDFHPGCGPHSTQGTTTGPSDVVADKGAIDKDRPTEASDSTLGELRARLTTLQDQVNVFLTDRMKLGAAKEEDDKDLERRILDDGVDEDDVE
ncbi:hypothetical protein BABINDRAFT_159136 [Babjeviella inositovora NRRL Y-12698]|uniref:EKC/KEOPS complex subunit GON7 n=1 Tax=Babjeviella inositovora NRRL Y-12698 TaxID=984486 RepID=A0A1E3QY93_9ASCO|nr:uncharacterized protein BABINDRAFT_159136 [Babjeviella inositovora NRRL Y-12698]ODQ82576.1 hypothetical protein BABINDRAFT_159136 [Babjeviella inositovora NRRL Y-12698]